jgi:hypothetical protein
VKLGARDARSGDWPLVSGVAAGEQLLRHATSTLVDGQRVDPKAAAVSAAR